MAIANTTLQIRKSGITSVKPTTLAAGELAINYADDKLYYKNSSGNISYFYGANNGPGFSTANANNTLLLASTPNDTLSIVAGNNTTITACTTTKTITVNAILDPAFTQANSAFNTANSAASFANGAFTLANTHITNITTIQGVDTTQNTNITSAQSFANSAFIQANNISSYANGQITIIAGVDTTQNTNITSAQSFANSAFVTANSGALFANAAFTKANTSVQLTAANQNVTGNVTITGDLSVTGNVVLNTYSALYATSFTTSTTTANQIIYSTPTTTYRSAKLMVQMTSGTSYQVTELLIIHNGTNAFMTQYGDIATTGTSLGTFDSSITSGNLNLLFTPTNAATTVKLSSSLIVL